MTSLTWADLPAWSSIILSNLAGNSIGFLPILLILGIGFLTYVLLPGQVAFYLVGAIILALGLYTELIPQWLFYLTLFSFLGYAFISLKERIFGS